MSQAAEEVSIDVVRKEYTQATIVSPLIWGMDLIDTPAVGLDDLVDDPPSSSVTAQYGYVHSGTRQQSIRLLLGFAR